MSVLLATGLGAQAQYWQQEADYRMDIEMDESANRFTGKQRLKYTNHSPFTLNKVYYHLYFNAFQPNSEMDVRSRWIEDPDKRIGDRISKLKPEEQGYHHILKLTQDGKPVNFTVSGTILEVQLDHTITPGKSAELYMEFESQVPLQVRRSGRDNAEGIRFSMTQWYPKLCEFDREGWHTDPYIAREFHGVWGSFEVNITIDSAYLIGATGVLQNAGEIGKGYEEEGQSVKRPESSRLTWRFKAERVHDFAWAADPDYVHEKTVTDHGTVIHLIYQPDSMTNETWPQLGAYMVKAFSVMNREFGEYPFPQFSYIQGGDGGMEYPMLTLITGRRNLGSLVGVSVHEMNHNWFQGVLAFDESHYYWMDEGFTEYSSAVVMQALFPNLGDAHFQGAYRGYLSIAGSGKEEPLTTHADWFRSNRAYGIAAYNKGSVFLSQLNYLVGDSVFHTTMLEFFNTWKFKHPTPDDLKILFELNSGMELDWYFNLWIESTRVIDYSVNAGVQDGDQVIIGLKNLGGIPMPLVVQVYFRDGSSQRFYVPQSIQRDNPDMDDITVLEDWRWVDTYYSFEFDSKKKVKRVEIDPDHRLADTDRENNILVFPK